MKKGEIKKAEKILISGGWEIKSYLHETSQRGGRWPDNWGLMVRPAGCTNNWANKQVWSLEDCGPARDIKGDQELLDCLEAEGLRILESEERWAEMGEIIRARRAERNWSQEELARRAGCSANTIARIERGVHKPQRMTVNAINRALDTARKRRQRQA